jgi:hypothetical protein
MEPKLHLLVMKGVGAVPGGTWRNSNELPDGLLHITPPRHTHKRLYPSASDQNTLIHLPMSQRVPPLYPFVPTLQFHRLCRPTWVDL